MKAQGEQPITTPSAARTSRVHVNQSSGSVLQSRAARQAPFHRLTRTVSIALPLIATHRSPLRSDEGPARVVIKNHTGPSGSRERSIPEYRFGLLRSLHGCGFRANVANVIPTLAISNSNVPKEVKFASFPGPPPHLIYFIVF